MFNENKAFKFNVSFSKLKPYITRVVRLLMRLELTAM